MDGAKISKKYWEKTSYRLQKTGVLAGANESMA